MPSKPLSPYLLECVAQKMRLRNAAKGTIQADVRRLQQLTNQVHPKPS